MKSVPRASDVPSKLPIYLSALLIPGAGQFVQRRWISAVFYSSTSLLCLVFFLIGVARSIISYLQLLWAVMNNEPSPSTHGILWRAILVPLGLVVMLYLIGLCDTYLAYLRDCRRWGEKKLEDKLKGLNPALDPAHGPMRE